MGGGQGKHEALSFLPLVAVSPFPTRLTSDQPLPSIPLLGGDPASLTPTSPPPSSIQNGGGTHKVSPPAPQLAGREAGVSNSECSGAAAALGVWGLSLRVSEQQRQQGAQYTTSYTVAFLSPEPVTMNLSLMEMSKLSTEDDSLDWKERGWG